MVEEAWPTIFYQNIYVTPIMENCRLYKKSSEIADYTKKAKFSPIIQNMQILLLILLNRQTYQNKQAHFAEYKKK